MARAPAIPKDAATVIVVRAAPGGGLEVFCVERNKQSRFMGGAIVFPGGKLDPSDMDAAWEGRTTTPRRPAGAREPFAVDDVQLRALAVAAARETLEEAALLHTAGGALDEAEVSRLRAELALEPAALATFLDERGLRLDLAQLVPIARWVTPVAEARRFDARFFVAVAPMGQHGAHDDHETMASFWATPTEVLRRFGVRELTLMPPTHRMLEVLASCSSPEDALALAAQACLEPICPKLVGHEDRSGKTLALVLPGDPEHELRDVRVPGRSRYVLREDQWLPEEPPR